MLSIELVASLVFADVTCVAETLVKLASALMNACCSRENSKSELHISLNTLIRLHFGQARLSAEGNSRSPALQDREVGLPACIIVASNRRI